MGFTEFRKLKEKLGAPDENEHAELLEAEVDEDVSVFRIRVKTSVAEDLAEKSQNYILESIPSSWFANDTVGHRTVGGDPQHHEFLIGDEEQFPHQFEVVRTSDLK